MSAAFGVHRSPLPSEDDFPQTSIDSAISHVSALHASCVGHDIAGQTATSQHISALTRIVGDRLNEVHPDAVYASLMYLVGTELNFDRLSEAFGRIVTNTHRLGLGTAVLPWTGPIHHGNWAMMSVSAAEFVASERCDNSAVRLSGRVSWGPAYNVAIKKIIAPDRLFVLSKFAYRIGLRPVPKRHSRRPAHDRPSDLVGCYFWGRCITVNDNGTALQSFDQYTSTKSTRKFNQNRYADANTLRRSLMPTHRRYIT